MQWLISVSSVSLVQSFQCLHGKASVYLWPESRHLSLPYYICYIYRTRSNQKPLMVTKAYQMVINFGTNFKRVYFLNVFIEYKQHKLEEEFNHEIISSSNSSRLSSTRYRYRWRFNSK